jgi:hypothetical protein
MFLPMVTLFTWKRNNEPNKSLAELKQHLKVMRALGIGSLLSAVKGLTLNFNC